MKADPEIDKSIKLPSGAEFHEGLAASWSEGYSRGSFQKRLVCFRRVLDRNVSSGQSWLDLGCGSGVLTKELIRIGAAAVVAVDGAPAMLKHAASTTGAPAGVDLSWIHGDVQAIPFVATESVDGVLCSSVIEYVDRPDAVLSEIARVLRPGGQFVVSLPPRWSVVRTAQKAARRLARYLGQDVFSYLRVSRFEVDCATLQEFFEDFGLPISRVTRFDPVLPALLMPPFRPALLVIEGQKAKP
jgi:SAM-dependent methyltransferase